MNREKFNGSWKGEYTYGQGYPREVRGTKQEFILGMTFSDTSFDGICEDMYTRDFFKKPANISGKVIGHRIWFSKRYPSLLTADENMQTIVVPDQPSLDIIYSGYYSGGLFSRAPSFRGEWKIIAPDIEVNGKIVTPIIGGKWSMKKVG